MPQRLLYSSPSLPLWVDTPSPLWKCAKNYSASNAQQAENQALRAELDNLRNRVEVLEQLVTDDSFQLKREFKRV